MGIQIRRFDPQASEPHGGSILASSVLPEGIKAPFLHADGSLEGSRTMQGHTHEADEIYFILSGTGYVYSNSRKDCNCLSSYLPVGNRKIRFHFSRSFLEFCRSAASTEKSARGRRRHSVHRSEHSPLLWTAFCWPHKKGGDAPQKEICVRRFEKEKAQSFHQGTLLQGGARYSGHAFPAFVRIS